MQSVNLAIRNPNVSSSAGEVKSEASEYVNVAGRAENIPATPGPKFSFFTQLFAPLTVCWLILLMIIILHVYFISVISENNTKLSADKYNLIEKINGLQTNNTQLSADKYNLIEKINELQTNNTNLTDQIMKTETFTPELNVSRAQWSINAYCPKASDGSVQPCRACQLGWYINQPYCYAYYDVQAADQLSWAEARGKCKGRISDMIVFTNEAEKNYVNGIIVAKPDITGYWIGLRAAEGKWKWINGSDMTNNAWIGPPTDNSQCVIFVKDQGWKQVLCENKNPWICKKNALSV